MIKPAEHDSPGYLPLRLTSTNELVTLTMDLEEIRTNKSSG